MNIRLLTILSLSSLLISGIASAAYDPAYIRNWLICGPFENSKLEDILITDEANLSPKPGDTSAGKAWKEYDSVENYVDFEDETAFGRYELSVAYAFAEINSPSKKMARLYLHSDDSIKVWLNGNNILTNDIARGMGQEDILTVMLRPGANRLVIKVRDYFAGWMFSARITDENGSAIKDLTFSPRPIPLMKLPVKKIWASSVQGGDFEQYSPKFTVDGNKNTRWSSEHYDPQSLIFDLGSPQEIKRIDLLWEAAYSKSYKIEVSDDKMKWQEVYKIEDGNGGKDLIPFPVIQKGRYLRIMMLERGTEWGNSLYEFSVYGFVPEGEKAAPEGPAEETVVELEKPIRAVSASASSAQKPNPDKNESFEAKNAVDGDLKTRWSSEFKDPQWISVDLGSVKRIDSIALMWENAYARAYSVEISQDAAEWKEIYSTASEKGGKVNIIPESPQSARYIKVNCKERDKKEWGYSLWEIEVFGE
jgi:hypothetical protein